MATKWIITSILFLAVIQVQTQFFDIFQDLRPFTIRPFNPYPQEITTKRPKTTTNQKNKHTNTQDRRPITRVTSEERDRQTTREKQRRKTTVDPFYSTKPNNRNNKNNTRDYSTSTSNIRTEFTNANQRNYELNQPWQDSVNKVQDYTTKAYGSRNQYTTYNPLYNRPGVKPAVVNTNRPPITNKPATRNPFAVFPRPTDGSVIRYPADPDDSPQVLTGPDEDSMSEVEKRRYAEVAERMCDKYKALNVQQVEAIPLLPSPELVRFNVTDCDAVSVPLVVGGKVVSIREFPHMALLGWTKLEGGGYSWKCGGSLISDRYVLTAGHCAYQDRDNTVVTGAPRVVQLGSSYLDDPGSLVVKVSSVYRHPKYTQSRSYYDIALLKLAKAVTFSPVVKPACLGVPPSVGEKVIATGWGRTEFGGDQSLELRSVSISIWDMQDCRRILSATRKLPNGPSSDSQICAGEKSGNRDTCQGDSGGPVQVHEGCIWRVVAITSVGRSCGAANTPAVYATIHKPFIAAQVFADQIKNEKAQNNFRTTDNRQGNNQRNNNRDTNYQGTDNRQGNNPINNNRNTNYQGSDSRQENKAHHYDRDTNYQGTDNRQGNNPTNDNRNTNYQVTDNQRNNANNYNRDTNYQSTDNRQENNPINNNKPTNYQGTDSRQENNANNYNRDTNYQGNRQSYNTDYRPDDNRQSYGQNNNNGNRYNYNTGSYQPTGSDRQSFHTDNYQPNIRESNNQNNNYNRQGAVKVNSRNNDYVSGVDYNQSYNGNSGSTDYVNNNSRDSNNYYDTSYNNRQIDNYRADIIYYPESK